MEEGCMHLKYRAIGARQLGRHSEPQWTASLALDIGFRTSWVCVPVMLLYVDNNGVAVLADVVMLHQIIREYKTKCKAS